MQKYAKKFAYIKKLLYLCTEIKKQDGAATRNSGKKVMITKTKTENGYSYKTNHYTRNDKRDFKYALLQVLKEGKIGIIKLANSESQMRAHVNRWWYSHAIAVEIESGKVLWEKVRA